MKLLNYDYWFFVLHRLICKVSIKAEGEMVGTDPVFQSVLFLSVIQGIIPLGVDEFCEYMYGYKVIYPLFADFFASRNPYDELARIVYSLVFAGLAFGLNAFYFYRNAHWKACIKKFSRKNDSPVT